MADLTRAEELVQTIERDAEFQAEVESAPTAIAKRQVLDAHGFQDIDLADMKAYVESKGGTLVVPESSRELSDDELAAVAGGMRPEEAALIGMGSVAGAGIVIAAASAAA